MKRRIIIPLGLGMAARNVLQTDVWKVLTGDPQLEIVLLVPAELIQEYQGRFGSDRVSIETLRPYTRSRIESVLWELAVQIFYRVNRVETFELRRLTHRPSRWTRIIQFGAKFFPKNLNSVNMVLRWQTRIFSVDWYDHLWTTGTPVTLWSTNPFDVRELPLLRSAQFRNIPTVAMILSWDNITSHTLLPTRFERILVWNTFLRNQLVQYYRYRPNEITITGIPQADAYYRPSSPISRDEFIRQIGGDPRKALITYTTAPQIISPHEPEIITSLLELITAGKLIRPSQLLIRIHPRDIAARYQRLMKPGVLINEPGQRSSAFDDKWDPQRSDIVHLANTLRYSDVIINVASSMNIDAAPFDRPVVNIAFDGPRSVPYLHSVRRYYTGYTHYIAMMRCGGSWLVQSPDELLTAINTYLAHPETHRAGRQRVVAEFCQFTDGRSGERIGRAIIEFVRDRS